MSFKQRIQDSIDSIWIVLTHHEDNIYVLRKDTQERILSLKKIYTDLQEQVVQLMRDQHQNDINVCGWKHQITDLKQEICGLKTGHKFEYKGDCGPIYVFTCKLCGRVKLKCENELTPAEKESLTVLGIVKRESTKKRGN